MHKKTISEYKPKINASVSSLLPHPIIRFKHLKRKVGDKMWKHYEKLHWKLEVAYSKNIETNAPDWFEVQDDYFYDNGEGNGEIQITLEEYRKNDL